MIGGPTPLSLEGARALPPVDRSAMPSDVRRGTPEQQRAYRAALGFERMLVGQLVRSMNKATEGMSSEEEGGGFGSTPPAYREMLADSLADQVIRGGGLGIAKDLYRSLGVGA